MKTIGILGGMSWESTALYYRLINEGVRDRLGGLHSAAILLDSVDFAPLEELQAQGDWPGIGRILSDKAARLQTAGAEGAVLATNSMHEVARSIEEAIDVPFLHIADATGAVLKRKGLKTVGLLGTRFTMERAFYTGRLEERFGISTIVPEVPERETVHRIIYEELCRGLIVDSSRQAYLDIMDELVSRGAQAVVLGCTEIGLLVREGDTDIPLYDTARIHVEAVVDWMLGKDST